MMAQLDPPNDTLTRQLAHFVPVDTWFDPSEPKNVAVQVFRVYGEPFAHRSHLPTAFLLTDFKSLKVRAAFVRADMILPDYDHAFDLFPTPDGGTELGPQTAYVSFEGEDAMYWSDQAIWRATGDGTLLLLMTPSLTKRGVADGAGPVPFAITETLTLARASIVATMGRNAAFEQLFECELVLEEDSSALGVMMHGRHDPEHYGRPKLDGAHAELSERFIERVEDLDERTRNRVKLALRWFVRAQRHPSPKGELKVDTFLNYWVAFEALAMPNEKPWSAWKKLAAIHGLTEEKAKNLFPVGPMQGLRARILHRGELYPLNEDLLTLLEDMFLDVLLHILGLLDAPRTDRYLDGSAHGLLPKMG